MYNNQYGTRENVGSQTQILADTTLQKSIGCRIPKSLGIAVGAQTIAKAGTPLRMNFAAPQTAASLATGTVIMNSVLLHDVDVTGGENNGTALIFGFVNVSNIDSVTATKLNTAAAATGASALIELLTL